MMTLLSEALILTPLFVRSHFFWTHCFRTLWILVLSQSGMVLHVGHPCVLQTDSVFTLYCKYRESYICSLICNELLIIHQAVLITSVLIRTQGYRLTSRDKNVNEEERW